jgi:hypothetical protein
MRTKALFVAAATGIAALTTSLAQVYSVNVVGYINIDLANGFTMIANQLDNGNGNLIVDVIGDQLDDGTIVYKWNGAGYDILTYDLIWDGTPSALAGTLAPGEGAFVRAPAAKTITVVGEVMEGANDVSIAAGFNIISSVAPVSTDLSAAGASWPAVDGDLFYVWDQAKNGGAGGYDIITYDLIWDPAPLVLEVGKSAWVRTAAAKTWTRDFSVPRS